MRHRIRHHGFPVLVLAGLAVSAYLAASTTVPHPVPAFALKAAAVYRLEVGAACFVAFYLAAMAVILALDGRGFAELGTKGLRAVEVTRTASNQQVSLSEQAQFNQDIKRSLEKTNAAVETTAEALSNHRKRLEKLEEERLT